MSLVIIATGKDVLAYEKGEYSSEVVPKEDITKSMGTGTFVKSIGSV